jgi:hypothetical protein
MIKAKADEVAKMATRINSLEDLIYGLSLVEDGADDNTARFSNSTRNKLSSMKGGGIGSRSYGNDIDMLTMKKRKGTRLCEGNLCSLVSPQRSSTRFQDTSDKKNFTWD